LWKAFHSKKRSSVIWGEVVGDHLAGGLVDDGGDGDPARVAGEALLVGVLELVDAEDGVDAARVEVEGPRVGVVRRPGGSERDRVLQPEQLPDDDRPVRPRAGVGRDQPVPAGRDGVVVGFRPRLGHDPRLDVAGVPVELLALDRVDAALGVLFVIVHGFTVPSPPCR
jgi:hypothetical protein